MDITSKCLCVCATWCFAPLSVKVSSIYSRQFKPVPVHNSLDDLGVVLLATLHSSVLPLHQAALTVSGPNLKKKIAFGLVGQENLLLRRLKRLNSKWE